MAVQRYGGAMEECAITLPSLSKVAKMEEGFTGDKEECGEPSKYLLYGDPEGGEESLNQQ